jgi:putative transposase
MKRKRYADEQVAFALRQVEGGTPVAEVCRKMGVSEATFFRWKKRFAGHGRGGDPAAEAARGREHEAQRLVADLTLDKTMLQDVLRRKW